VSLRTVVEPVFGPIRETAGLWDFHCVGKGKDQCLLAGPHVEPPNADVGGRGRVTVRVRDARVAVAGPRVIEPAEIRSQPPTAVRAETIERMRQRAFHAALHVQDMAKAACRSTRANGISAHG